MMWIAAIIVQLTGLTPFAGLCTMHHAPCSDARPVTESISRCLEHPVYSGPIYPCDPPVCLKFLIPWSCSGDLDYCIDTWHWWCMIHWYGIMRIFMYTWAWSTKTYWAMSQEYDQWFIPGRTTDSIDGCRHGVYQTQSAGRPVHRNTDTFQVFDRHRPSLGRTGKGALFRHPQHPSFF